MSKALGARARHFVISEIGGRGGLDVPFSFFKTVGPQFFISAQIYSALYEGAMVLHLCAQHGRRTLTQTSVIEFC